MFEKLKNLLPHAYSEEEFQQRMEELRREAPVPIFWMIGKTQTGKTSIVRFLTGADDAEIGQGFQTCTRFSRIFQFPTAEAPLLTFLDTRGLEEPGYDPAEDLEKFDNQAHLLIITVKVLDHAQENLLKLVKDLRRRKPDRPLILVLTCLHEAYPQRQHPVPEEIFRTSAWETSEELARLCPDLLQSLLAQKNRFAGLYDYLVPVDLTQPAEGFEIPDFGGAYLKEMLQAALPAAYRQTLINLEWGTKALQDLYARRAMPHILAYSSLAATAGAIPIPWVDLLILPGIQSNMIFHLAKLYGQPLSAQRFLELAGTLGLGMVVRQAVREVVKFVPFVGSVAGAALAGSATFALGQAFCYYYSSVHKGHVPKPEDLRKYYHEQLAEAEKRWKK